MSAPPNVQRQPTLTDVMSTVQQQSQKQLQAQIRQGAGLTGYAAVGPDNLAIADTATVTGGNPAVSDALAGQDFGQAQQVDAMVLQQMADIQAFYDFMGEVLDASGNGNNGTLNGTVAYSDAGSPTGGGLVFDGSTTYETMAALPLNGSQATVAVWLKFASVAGNQYVCNINGNSTTTGAIGIQYSGGTLYFYVNNGALYGSVAWAPGTTGWHHVVATFNGGTLALYIDGAAQTLTITGSASSLVNAPTPSCWIGQQGGATQFLDATVAQFRYYTRALSSTEVSNLYSDPSYWPNSLVRQGLWTLPPWVT